MTVTIDDVLDSLGVSSGATVEALQGTGNRSFSVRDGDLRYVIRFDGTETGGLVDRRREHVHAREADRLGIGPRVLVSRPYDGVLVTELVVGKRLDAIDRPFPRETLGRLGTALRSLQTSTAFETVMDPWAKISFYLDDSGQRSAADAEAFGRLWDPIEARRDACHVDHTSGLVPCHVDLVPANAFDTGDAVILIDWEYSALSHRMWDPAYFSVEAGLGDDEIAGLLGALEPAVDPQTFHDWMIVARAVSLAWCLARLARAERGADLWRAEIERRRCDLAKELRAPRSGGTG